MRLLHGLFRVVGLTLFAACTSDARTTRLCEPPGAKLAPPGGGDAVLHAVGTAPEQLSDGLPVSTLEAEGIEPEPIGEMLDAVRTGTFTKVDSVLIARNGKLVLEAYFNGFERETKHDTRSAFKSITSALAGIAIDQGLIPDVERPVSSYFPEYWPRIAGDVDAKARISLHHLLTMTPGFDAEESAGQGPNREEDMFRSDDWVAFTLDLPMAHEPGTVFSYNSSTTFLLGEIVARAAGESLPSFAKAHLFEPLGITDYCWTVTGRGRAVAQGNFFVRPRDMLKLGQLFLDRGSWRGRQVVSARWVDESTRHHVNRRASAAGNEQPDRNGYGYQWWTRSARGARFDHYFASGNGGQKIYVFPRLQIVAVFTGSHYNRAIGHRQPTEMFNQYIVPAVRP